MSKVYLAGGFRGEWREAVKQIGGFDFIDPKIKEAAGEWDIKKAGAWDLHGIRQGDIVFAYMEKTNPSGLGLACEIGYAFGLNKTVILVLEKENITHKDRYLEFMSNVASITFDNLPEGIAFLETLK